MKALIALFFGIISLKGCNQQTAVQTDISKASKVQQTEIKIQYQAISRGFFYKTTLEKGTIAVQKTPNETDAKKAPCPEKDWETASVEIEKLNLSAIGELKAPSTKSHYDGAASASLIISIGDKVYTSSSFDHGNPPTELKPLIDKMLALAETVENP